MFNKLVLIVGGCIVTKSYKSKTKVVMFRNREKEGGSKCNKVISSAIIPYQGPKKQCIKKD